MCIFEVMSHIIDIVNYLAPCGMLLKQVPICLNGFIANIFVDLVCGSFSWHGFSQCVPLYNLVENHVPHVMLIIAFHDCVTF